MYTISIIWGSVFFFNIISNHSHWRAHSNNLTPRSMSKVNQHVWWVKTDLWQYQTSGLYHSHLSTSWLYSNYFSKRISPGYNIFRVTPFVSQVLGNTHSRVATYPSHASEYDLITTARLFDSKLGTELLSWATQGNFDQANFRYRQKK